MQSLLLHQSQARSQTFVCVCVCVGGGGGGGVRLVKILGPFMITRGLSCDRVGFGLFWGGGGADDPLTLPPPTPRYGPESSSNDSFKSIVILGDNVRHIVLLYYYTK